MTDEPNTPRSEPELLPVVSTTISEYSPIAAGLAELRAQVQAHLPSLDCSTPAGDKLARQSRFALVKLRTRLEAERVKIKAPALEQCQLIDAEAKRITAEIEALEKPFDDAIKAQEAKVAAEKAEADRREQARKAAVEAEIEDVRRAPLGFMNAASADVAAELARVQGMSFDHLTDAVERDRAQTAQREAIGALTGIHGNRLQHEAAEEKLAADRAENERIAREARERQEAEDKARAEQQAKEDAERAAKQAEEDRAAAQRRAEEQAEGERRRRNEATIRTIREKPVALYGAPVSILTDEIAALTDGFCTVDADYLEQATAARDEAVQRLQTMLAEQQKRDAEAAEYRELQAKQARERQEEQERQARERAEREEAAIASATLREAAEDAFELLATIVDEDHLVLRKLAAALARDVQP